MRISKFKIDWRFLVPWVGIGFVTGIGILLPSVFNISVVIQIYSIGLLSLLLQYLLLRKYMNKASTFVFVALILSIPGFFIGNFGWSSYAPAAILSLGFSLLVSIGQWFVLRKEFQNAYLWIVGTGLASIVSGLYQLTIFTFVGMIFVSAAFYGGSPFTFLLYLFSPLVVHYLISGLILWHVLSNPIQTDKFETLELETL